MCALIPMFLWIFSLVLKNRVDKSKPKHFSAGEFPQILDLLIVRGDRRSPPWSPRVKAIYILAVAIITQTKQLFSGAKLLFSGAKQLFSVQNSYSRCKTIFLRLWKICRGRGCTQGEPWEKIYYHISQWFLAMTRYKFNACTHWYVFTLYIDGYLALILPKSAFLHTDKS